MALPTWKRHLVKPRQTPNRLAHFNRNSLMPDICMTCDQTALPGRMGMFTIHRNRPRWILIIFPIQMIPNGYLGYARYAPFSDTPILYMGVSKSGWLLHHTPQIYGDSEREHDKASISGDPFSTSPICFNSRNSWRGGPDERTCPRTQCSMGLMAWLWVVDRRG